LPPGASPSEPPESSREKITAWSSTSAGGQPAFSRDLLLGTLTLYRATGDQHLLAVALPGLPARARHRAAGRRTGAGTDHDHHLRRRTGPFPKPPRELAERYFHVTSWAEHDRGGHFPAAAEPRLPAQALRDAFRPLRS